MTNKNRPIIFSIDGNIGSGKTTLLNELKNHFKDNTKVVFLPEPVNIWTSIVDQANENILEKFYNNKSKYSFSFQILAFISRLKLLQEAISNNEDVLLISERCLLTDRYVFAKMLHDDGYIEEIEMNIYNYWFDHFIKDMLIEKIIYVDTPAHKCYERIKKRSRHGEEGIDLTYLETCDEYHKESFLPQFTSDQVDIFDGSIDVDDNKLPFLSDVIEIIENQFN